MIDRYRDHAANERTYLAWVRTGITVVIMGFIVEKFDLFLASLHGLVAGKSNAVHYDATASEISMALATFGVLVIIAGTLRFYRVRVALDSPEGTRFGGSFYFLLLSLALVGFGLYLILYMRSSLLGV